MSRRRGWDVKQVICTEDSNEYNQNMDGVDRGNQLREHGSGLYNKAHFKQWYKRGHLVLYDFGLLNSHISWNMSCEQMVVRGVKMR